jgi:hypothetical protein
MSSDDHDLDAAEAQTTTALRTYMTSEGGDDYAAITDFVEPVVDLYADQPVELGKVGDTVRSLWGMIIDTAETTPYYDASQDRLVDFVRKIKSLPPPTNPVPQFYDATLWSELPMFRWSMRDRWNHDPGMHWHLFSQSTTG